jgi:ribose 1,5-bisphosphokinase PhnN
VIEDAGEIQRYRHALRGQPLRVCRITAHESVLRARLTSRHRDDPEGLRWHLSRATELDSILAKQALDDFVVESSDASAESVAREVLNLVALQRVTEIGVPPRSTRTTSPRVG